MALQTWTKENDRLKQENELLKQLTIAGGREPNPDDAPYRPAHVPNPGKPPWPGYPNPPKLAGNPSFDINESSSTRKIRGIRNLGEKGSAGEKDAAVEMLKRLGGPQLPQVNLPGHGLTIAGHQELTDYLDRTGRSGRTGSYKDSGKSPEDILKYLMIGAQKFKA